MNLQIKNFFDLADLDYPELFLGEPFFEIIGSLGQFIEKLFKEGKIKGNFSKNVFIGENVSIDPTAKIEGPAIILDNSKIGFQALVRENVFIGKDSNIGHASEIKNSIILNHSTLSHFNYVSDSILGNNVRVGAGAKTANRRLDRANIILKVGDEKIDTKLTRFGAIIGDGTKIGVNAVLNPGTVLEKNCLVYPLKSVSGFYRADSKI